MTSVSSFELGLICSEIQWLLEQPLTASERESAEDAKAAMLPYGILPGGGAVHPTARSVPNVWRIVSAHGGSRDFSDAGEFARREKMAGAW